MAAGGGAPWVGEGTEADWAVWDGHGAGLLVCVVSSLIVDIVVGRWR